MHLSSSLPSANAFAAVRMHVALRWCFLFSSSIRLEELLCELSSGETREGFHPWNYRYAGHFECSPDLNFQGWRGWLWDWLIGSRNAEVALGLAYTSWLHTGSSWVR